jgi:hypothetical protein
MAGLTAVVQRLVAVRVIGHLWVDGSLMTEKIDPEDADLLLRISSDFLDRRTQEQWETLEWFADRDRKTTHHCDSYRWVEYPIDHDLYMQSEWDRAYWIRQYGFSRRDVQKGIAVLELTGGAV